MTGPQANPWLRNAALALAAYAWVAPGAAAERLRGEGAQVPHERRRGGNGADVTELTRRGRNGR